MNVARPSWGERVMARLSPRHASYEGVLCRLLAFDRAEAGLTGVVFDVRYPPPGHRRIQREWCSVRVTIDGSLGYDFHHGSRPRWSELSPGRHVIEARPDGFGMVQRAVELELGTVQIIRIVPPYARQWPGEPEAHTALTIVRGRSDGADSS